MERAVSRWLWILVLGCSDESYGVECSQRLPLADFDGTPWPTYAAVNAPLADCSQLEALTHRRRGGCSDGKQFLAKGGDTAGDILFFDGETLVGKTEWSNVTLCQDGYRYGDTRCEEIDVEEISCP
jgi:hypothetical protein